jgi:hypothetical protein
MIEFDKEAIQDLLHDLDVRLRQRGVAASVYIVGGAAIALRGTRDERRTADVDAMFNEPAVTDEAATMAAERHLPPNWLNAAAQHWLPPLPAEAIKPPAAAGLTILIAPEDHLLAMKLVALRSKDAGDIVALAKSLGMGNASAQDFADLLERVYGSSDYLETVLGPGRDEPLRIGERTVRMLKNRRTREG